MGNHQACLVAWKFLIMRQLLLRWIWCFKNKTNIIVAWILSSLMKKKQRNYPKKILLNLQLLNKDYEYMGQWRKKKLSRSKYCHFTKATSILLEKINRICGKFAWWSWSLYPAGKKDKTIQYISIIIDTGLMISTVVTRWVSIAAFVSGVGLPDDIVLSGIRETFSLATAISRKSFKTFTIKQ